jgi:cytochrome c peroxidase
VKSKVVLCILILFVATGSLLMNGCRKSSFDLTPITFTSPSGFPSPQYNFTYNPLSEEGFQLGKKLFFDGRLSKDGHFACASCHQPVAAFTTFEHDRSHGYNNSHTLRNATGLFNLAWLPEYNQDGSAKTLDEVYRNHITNAKEMGETIPVVLQKLAADEEYKKMFKAAFGDEKITEQRMFKAISQYVVNLVSADAKYDKVKKGEASFTAEEQTGYMVFQAKCASCHKEPLFTDYSYRNNGLAVDAGLNDHGRLRVTGNAADDLKFRVPSLRNAELTSYYGHDGRMSVFRMMLQHYQNGIVQSPTLDPLLTTGITMTAAEENSLVAFIRTLSDSAFLNNPRFRQ